MPLNKPDAQLEKPKNKMPRYLFGLLILLAVCAVLVSAALLWVYTALTGFEAGTPNAALTRYFTNYAAGNFDALHDEADFSPNIWNSWQAYDDYLRSLYGNIQPQALRYQKSGAVQGGGHVYTVFTGTEKLAELYLYPLGQGQVGYRVATPLAYTGPCRIQAPEIAQVYVNGRLLTAENAGIEKTPAPAFAHLPEDIAPPLLHTYTLAPLLHAPEISASAPLGAACSLVYDENLETTIVSVSPAQGTQNEYATRMVQVAKAYANFISEDISFAGLRGYLLPGTDFYSRMRSYYVGWYVPHDSFAFLNMETHSILSYSGSFFVGEVNFTYEVYRGANTASFPSAYRLAFALVGGQWLLVNLQVL